MGYPKMITWMVYGKKPLKWMIWGSPHLWKPSHVSYGKCNHCTSSTNQWERMESDSNPDIHISQQISNLRLKTLLGGFPLSSDQVHTWSAWWKGGLTWHTYVKRCWSRSQQPSSLRFLQTNHMLSHLLSSNFKGMLHHGCFQHIEHDYLHWVYINKIIPL